MRTLSDGIELDLRKTAEQAERDITVAENEFDAAVLSALKEAAAQVQAFFDTINSELVKPLKEDYEKNSGSVEKFFINDLSVYFSAYQSKIAAAENIFRDAFGSEYFHYNVYLPMKPDYTVYFNTMRGTNLAQEPVPYKGTIKTFGALHGIYGNIRSASNLGDLGIAPIVAATVAYTVTTTITDKAIKMLMDIPAIQDICVKVIQTALAVYSGLYYAFNRDVQESMQRSEVRANKLKNRIKAVTDGFNKIVTAIQILQNKIGNRFDIYIGKTSENLYPAEQQRTRTTPVTVTPSVTRRESGSTAYSAPSAAANRAYVPYTIKPAPAETKTAGSTGLKYEREYLSSGDDNMIQDFSPLQHATHILINKERFPYER